MRKKIFCLSFVLIVFISCFWQVLAGENVLLVAPVRVFDLPNGQRIIIKEVHTNPIVSIDTWVRTGSVNETPENNGVAHFLEHLIFKGTEKHPTGQIEEIIESKGGMINAATSKDYTHFYVTIASEYFDTVLPLHADMVLNAAIPPEELEKERNVVLEEIRRAEDNPDRQVYYGLNDLLFKEHPYKYDTLGTSDVIKNISREKILEFYKKWYVPSNMTTVVVGDIDTEKVLELIKENFGTNITERMDLPEYTPEPPLTESLEIIKKDDINQAYLEIGFHSPSMKAVEKTYALDVASIILGQGRASRLYKRLKFDKNLVNSLYVTNYPMKDSGVFVFDFELQPENIDKVRQIVFEEIEKIKTVQVTEEELARAKNQVQRDFIYDNESVGNIATSIGYNVTLASLEEYTEYVDKVNSVTREDVMEAAKKYLDTSAMATSILLPEKTPESANKENDVDNKEAEQPSSDKNCLQVSNEGVQKLILPNGITLLLKSNPANDVVSTDVFIKGGKLLQDKPGQSALVANMLMKGTDSRTAEDIAQETEDLGININISAQDDYTQITVKSTRSDFPEAFMVLIDILKNSNFKQEEIDKVKESMVNAVKAVEDSPLSYSFQNLYIALYGNHPYGEVGDVILKSLPGITREDLIEFYKKYYIPENLVISVVGNISEEVARRYVEQSWSVDNNNKPVMVNKIVSQLKKKKVIKVSKDTEAASISMGWLAPSMSKNDYAALKVLNSYLSGGLSSRLSRSLREEKGLAYQVGSFYPSRKEESMFVFFIGTEPKNINTAVQGFKDEIKLIMNEAISEEELDYAKQKIIGSYALSHETNSQQGFYLGWFESSGIGYEFDQEFPKLIDAVTVADVQQAAKKVFNNPSILSIVAPKDALDQLKE